MKKIIAFFLLLCMIVTITACNDKENAGSEITLQEIYDASKVASLLENHESVYIVRTENGKVSAEEYYSKEYSFIFYYGEIYGMDFDEAFFVTDHSYIVYSDNSMMRLVPITPDGMTDMAAGFAKESELYVFMDAILNDTITSVTEKDGHIIVTSITDQEEIDSVEGLVSCEEELVLDAKTREFISVKGIFCYETEVYENVTTFIFDAEIPENMKKFVECDRQTTDMRTITVVTNPGAENEKIESVQSPKGMKAGLMPDSEYYDRKFTMYADEACTQVFGTPDVNSDVTVYIKWDE